MGDVLIALVRSKLFIRLGVVTVLSFLILFLPFLPPFAPLSAILDPITRIFPFNRGLFEDKVANFWCATNVVLKWKLWAAQSALIKLSTALTAFGFLPAVTTLLFTAYKLRMQPGAQEEKTTPLAAKQTPILPLLPYALLTSSLSFFLFSFQVHEKTILVPLLPMTLLLSGSAPEEPTFELGMLMNNTAMFRYSLHFSIVLNYALIVQPACGHWSRGMGWVYNMLHSSSYGTPCSATVPSEHPTARSYGFCL